MWAGEEATVLRQTLPQSPLYILMMCTAHEADLISATPAAHTHTRTHTQLQRTPPQVAAHRGIKVNGSKCFGNETLPANTAT